MKNLLFVLMLIVLVGCGAPAPEGEESATTDPSMETAVVEEVEGEEEEETLEVPPEGALPLSEIIAQIEIAGHIAITEVEFENGVWQVDYVVGGEAHELEIDPMTGEALSDDPETSEHD